jgi:hypothetical protein
MPRPPREDEEPWYKQFWPWFIISIPAATVVAAMYTIKLAVDTSDGLVSDDYYKEGLAVNKDLSRQRLAKTFGLSAGLTLDQDTGELRARLQGKLVSPPGVLVLKLFHPTIKGLDQTHNMLPVGEGVYVTRLNALDTANWQVSLTPENAEWKLSGRARFPEALSGSLTP